MHQAVSRVTLYRVGMLCEEHSRGGVIQNGVINRLDPRAQKLDGRISGGNYNKNISSSIDTETNYPRRCAINDRKSGRKT